MKDDFTKWVEFGKELEKEGVTIIEVKKMISAYRIIDSVMNGLNKLESDVIKK
ncbi:hypothetical protein ACFFIX_10335 [Metabacillus herbersteinensis]|uniref:Uncharacterized protein n=1 Tax=Metabacillus herbersteinensis TaxID=283816 RepID=A0ABV6GDT5_9BACI